MVRRFGVPSSREKYRRKTRRYAVMSSFTLVDNEDKLTERFVLSGFEMRVIIFSSVLTYLYLI